MKEDAPSYRPGYAKMARLRSTLSTLTGVFAQEWFEPLGRNADMGLSRVLKEALDAFKEFEGVLGERGV